MPRQARKKAESGIYHIVLRGINRQQIFEEHEDYQHFLDTLEHYKGQCGYKLYAYCLMGNHVHLLLKEGKEDLTLTFKRIAGSFVYWYNWKYRRCGHLFQDRFKSEPVEDDAYFLTVLRYIHQNPVKAKICKKAEDYPYSSMQGYLTASTLAETGFALSMLSMDEFIKYHRAENEDKCLDVEDRYRLTDDEARKLLVKIAKCKTASEFQALEIKERNIYIKKLHAKGMSIRQISRLTGLTKKVVENHI